MQFDEFSGCAIEVKGGKGIGQRVAFADRVQQIVFEPPTKPTWIVWRSPGSTAEAIRFRVFARDREGPASLLGEVTAKDGQFTELPVLAMLGREVTPRLEFAIVPADADAPTPDGVYRAHLATPEDPAKVVWRGKVALLQPGGDHLNPNPGVAGRS